MTSPATVNGTSTGKRLSIIIASFNDKRIVRTIQSVRFFDDANTVRLVIVDGGSRPDVAKAIRPLLAEGDIFVSEPDRGIFDGLNKGLALCTTDYLGWLGSDDLFTGTVRASDVLAGLEDHDIFVADVAFFRGNRIRRITYAAAAGQGLVKFGMHNPHYGTFGRCALLCSERFDLSLLGSDIDYFHKIFDKNPRVALEKRIVTLQHEGGFSNASFWKTMRINYQLLATYARFNNKLLAPFLLLVKLGYKACSRCYFSVFPKDIRMLKMPFLVAHKDIEL